MVNYRKSPENKFKLKLFSGFCNFSYFRLEPNITMKKVRLNSLKKLRKGAEMGREGAITQQMDAILEDNQVVMYRTARMSSILKRKETQ